MELTASAPGKLILLGEYAVLDGADALVWAVHRRARVVARVTGAGGLTVDAPDIDVAGARADLDRDGTVCWRGLDAGAERRLGMVAAAVTGAVRLLASRERELPGLELRIDTAAFFAGGDKLGVGSSAAVVTALTGALLAAGGLDIEDPAGRRRVFEVALASHNRAQGHVGSGIDVAASTFGGALRYRVGSALAGPPTPVARAPPGGLRWVAVWTGRARATPSMVADVRRFARDHPATYRAYIAELAATSAGGCDAFAAGDLDAFLAAARDYDRGLARLGAAAGVDIVSVDHQRIGSIVRAEGGVYKPSGAGGGDVGIAFTKEAAGHHKVAAALERGGCTTVDLAVDQHGLRLEP